MNAQMSFEMSLAREHLGADVTLKQHIWLHVPHLYVHLQDVLVLQQCSQSAE